MLETKITEAIHKYLDSVDAWYFKVWGNAFQMSGVPDTVGCYRGRFVALETKTAEGRLRGNQKKRIRDIRKAGGVAEVVRSVEDVQTILDKLDKCIL